MPFGLLIFFIVIAIFGFILACVNEDIRKNYVFLLPLVLVVGLVIWIIAAAARPDVITKTTLVSPVNVKQIDGGVYQLIVYIDQYNNKLIINLTDCVHAYYAEEIKVKITEYSRYSLGIDFLASDEKEKVSYEVITEKVLVEK